MEAFRICSDQCFYIIQHIEQEMGIDLISEFIQLHIQGKVAQFVYSFIIADPFLQKFWSLWSG
jgi:hypothetical protein